MSFVSALGIGPLRWKATITTNAPPTFGDCNVYNTTTFGSRLIVALPQAAVQTVGAQMLLEIDPADTTLNGVIFNTYGTEQFTDDATSLTLTAGGCTVQVVNKSGVLQWKIVSSLGTSDLTQTPATTPDPDPNPGGVLIELRSAQETAAGTGYGGFGSGDYGYGEYSSSGYGYGGYGYGQ